jgi:hypothetical protein
VPKIQQFGSLITGLALETSDMDMAVTNLFLPDRQKMIDCLDLFANDLRKWEMIRDLNAISTASIPVIKANIDLNLLREKEIDKTEKNETPVNDFGQTQNDLGYEKHEKKRPLLGQKQSLLKIDITFDDNQGNNFSNNDNYLMDQNSSYIDQTAIYDSTNPKTHQGLASCNLIKKYVEHYKCLKEVSIILKQFLDEHDLNTPYQGKFSFLQLTFCFFRRNKFLLDRAPPRCLYEQVESQDERNSDPIATVNGFLGLLQLLFQRFPLWYRRLKRKFFLRAEQSRVQLCDS